MLYLPEQEIRPNISNATESYVTPFQPVAEAMAELSSREITHEMAMSERGSTKNTSNTDCRILSLPAEIREQIWIHAVTNWTRDPSTNTLIKQPIRVDNLNRPLPPGLTRVNRQLYTETLHLYYIHNIFECWRPLIHSPLWSSSSTLMYWLNSLGPEKVALLTSIVLLYKKESELEVDFHQALAIEGWSIKSDVLSFREELSEYELCYEQLGLPRHFGRRRPYR